MDKQDTLKNILLAAGVFMIIMAVAPRILPTPPAPRIGSDVPVSTDATPTEPTDATTTPVSITPGTEFIVREAEAAETVAIGAEPTDGVDKKNPGHYRMRLAVSNVGASIESADMTDHAQELHKPDRYRLLNAVVSDRGIVARSLAIEKFNIDDVDVQLFDKKWHIGPATEYTRALPDGSSEQGTEVSLWIELVQGDAPAVKLTRTYRLPKQPRTKGGRHDLWTDLTIENVSDVPHSVVVSYLGGLGVPRGNERMPDQAIDIGVREGGVITVARKAATGVAKATGQSNALFMTKPGEDRRFVWLADANTYFTCTIAPQTVAGEDAPQYIAAASAVDLDGSADTQEDVTGRLVTALQRIQPGATVRYPASLFVGEKDADAFRGIADYTARNYYDQISIGFGKCTFTFLVELMVWLLEALHYVLRDYGLAIVALVLIVRTILHPITKKGQVNMVRMQTKMGEFSPKLEELKKKYANDKARFQQEQMKLYREEGINPAGQLFTCLPMALQMPIWVALFLSLSNNIGMRHQGAIFLPWVDDLTAQDALIPFVHPLTIPLLGWQLHSFNLLPPLVALFMYIQQKTQPKPEPNPNASPEQRQQQEMMQKMMPMMSIMMLVIFYNMPSGLNLYIMFSSMFGWIEQKRIRAHIKVQKEAGKLAKPKRDEAQSRRPAKPSLFQKLQAMAENAQKHQAKRGPRKGKGKQ